MKKLIIMMILLLFLVGCQKIDDLSYDEIVLQKTNSVVGHHNVNRSGYTYYLPIGIQIITHDEYNDILASSYARYYLYVDLIGYYHHQELKPTILDATIYSRAYENLTPYRYLQIMKIEKNKYLIEIIYNYAKIEVVVDKDKLKSSLADAVAILSSIEYNNQIIANLMEKDALNFSEEKFDLFSGIGKKSNILEMFEADNDDETKEDVRDPDLIN